MIYPCDTPFQQRAKKAGIDACMHSNVTLWHSHVLTPWDFQDFEGDIDLYTGSRVLEFEEILKLQSRLRDAGWHCEVRCIEGARDPWRVTCECRGEEDPIWWWEEADHFEDGALILRLRMSELPKEEQK